MEAFFPEKFLGEIFWHETPIANQSAFIAYTDIPGIESSSSDGSNSKPMNMNKRMIEFLRRSCPLDRIKASEYERERCFRHMINERMRRQRQKQSCLALHALLPYGTKSDNNTVIQTAAREIERLKQCKDELQRQNAELQVGHQVGIESDETDGTRIKVEFNKTLSGVDSILETLKCLKSLGINTKTIKSNLSADKLLAVLEADYEIAAAAEIERAIKRKLNEAEGKFLGPQRPFQQIT